MTGLLNCCSAAEQVVSSFNHPLVKVCPLHLASAQTKQIARKSRGIVVLFVLICACTRRVSKLL